jgi:hypothetical protein
MKTNKPKNKYDIIIGIDSGETSGAAVLLDGKLMPDYLHDPTPAHGMTSYGHITTNRERFTVVSNSFYTGASRRTGVSAILFLFEDWPSPYLPNKKRMGHKQLLSMGENRGRWLETIEIRLRDYEITNVATRTWRKGYGLNGYPKEQVKKMAIDVANKLFNIKVVDDNEAEALLIAYWGYQNYGR